MSTVDFKYYSSWLRPSNFKNFFIVQFASSAALFVSVYLARFSNAIQEPNDLLICFNCATRAVHIRLARRLASRDLARFRERLGKTWRDSKAVRKTWNQRERLGGRNRLLEPQLIAFNLIKKWSDRSRLNCLCVFHSSPASCDPLEIISRSSSDCRPLSVHCRIIARAWVYPAVVWSLLMIHSLFEVYLTIRLLIPKSTNVEAYPFPKPNCCSLQIRQSASL